MASNKGLSPICHRLPKQAKLERRARLRLREPAIGGFEV
jgi:hypothetical protein